MKSLQWVMCSDCWTYSLTKSPQWVICSNCGTPRLTESPQWGIRSSLTICSNCGAHSLAGSLMQLSDSRTQGEEIPATFP